MNEAVLDKLIEEAVIAGKDDRFATASSSDIVYTICEIVDIDPGVSTSIYDMIITAYDYARRWDTKEVDELLAYIKSTSSYRFLRDVYDG